MDITVNERLRQERLKHHQHGGMLGFFEESQHPANE